MINPSTRVDLIECCDERHLKDFDPKTVDLSNFLTVSNSLHKVIFLILYCESDAEIHILCPKKSIIFVRDAANEILKYLKDKGILCAYTIVLNGYKKAYNMAIKLGFDIHSQTEDSTIFRRQLCQYSMP